jgi:hypothetical protein
MVQLLLFHVVDKNCPRRVTIRDSFLRNVVHLLICDLFLFENLRKMDEGCIESVMVRGPSSQHLRI